MRFDLSPLYRSTVGFDSLASMLDQVASFDNEADTLSALQHRASYRERIPHHHGGRWVRQSKTSKSR